MLDQLPTTNAAIMYDPQATVSARAEQSWAYRWLVMPVPYWIDANCPAIVSKAFEQAAAMWGSIARVKFEKSKKRLTYVDGKGYVVSWLPGGWIGGGQTLALTQPIGPGGQQFGTSLGPQLGGGMNTILNGLNYDWHIGDPWWVPASSPGVKPIKKPQPNLTLVLLHEMGHALGLSHSSDIADVMYPTLHPGQNIFGDGDIARIKALYP